MKRPRLAALSRLPLVTQVMGLVMFSLAAAISVNFALVWLVPPPPPEIYRASEAIAALRSPGQVVTARNGRSMTAQLRPGSQIEPATPASGRPQRLERWLARDAATQLGLAEGEAHVLLPASPVGISRRNIHIMHGQMGEAMGGPPPGPPSGPPSGPPRDGPGPPDRPGPRPPPPDFNPARRDRMGYPGLRPSPGDPFLIAPFQIEARRPDGRWAYLNVEETGLLSNWRRRILLGFFLSVLALAPFAYLFSRWLAAPIAAFAAAAERLGRDPGAPPLEIRGPAEVSVAASAFNDMQLRIRRYVQDRTAMMGAVAHDLRTPLTRLRFRIEQAPEELRGKLAADLDEMEAMIAATLAFVRDASQPGQRSPLELRSLVEAVATDMAETGRDVTLELGDPVILHGDSLALRRLVTNLAENAVKFGHRARMRVTASPTEAVIEVDDDGPGLPEADCDRVFEPFVRTEPSRSRQTGGAGLGLAVVRSVARAHGGDAQLHNRDDGGLRARVTLPI